MNWVRNENFKIRGYEIGPDHRVPLQNICGYMEEAASLHADELGFSVPELASRGLAWALTGTWIEFENLPYLGGEVLKDERSSWIKVKTWPVEVERLRYRRDFFITWRDGPLARAVTDWVVINLETRRVERIPDFILDRQPPEPERVLPADRRRLPEQAEAPFLASFTVRRADIDRVNHVNNARFTEWIAESVPGEVSAGRRLKSLRIMYRAEGRYGDEVVARGGPDSESGFLVSLLRRSDGRELVRASTAWTPDGQ